MRFGKKKKQVWQSARSGKSHSRRRIEDAMAKGSVRDQVRDIASSDRSKILMFGDLLLFWSDTVPGRVVLSTGSLLLAWVLI